MSKYHQNDLEKLKNTNGNDMIVSHFHLNWLPTYLAVHSNEIGKMYSSVAFVAALVPLAGHPAYKQLFNATIRDFPGAYFLLTSGVLLVALACNTYIFTKRDNLITHEEDARNNRAKEDDQNQQNNSQEMKSI